jgi:uncharacterized protein YyaL (SSP411 family)
VALALIELYEVTGDERYKEAATANVEWAVSNCAENGWFKNCAFDIESMPHPTTHVIGYTIEGILGVGSKLNERKFIEVAIKSADSLLKKFQEDEKVKATYNKDWQSRDNYSCLTGNAQIAIIWFKLYQLTKNSKYKINSIKLNDLLKSTQLISTKNKGLEGAIKGSHPITGQYNQFSFINWATKFFCDSMLCELTIEKADALTVTGTIPLLKSA